MRATKTGLRTILYTFNLNERDKMKQTMDAMSHLGIVQEVFCNNELAFEITLHRFL